MREFILKYAAMGLCLALSFIAWFLDASAAILQWLSRELKKIKNLF